VGGARDVGSSKLETVLSPEALGPVSEPGLVQNAIEEVTGFIARKDAARAVGAVGTGSESDDEQPGRGVAERGYGQPPIFLILIGASADTSNFGTVKIEARAEAASYDGLAKCGKLPGAI
jgi:hypothetical protein